MEYIQPKQIPDCRIKPPLERIKELCTMVHFATNETQVKNAMQLIKIEIARYDVERFGTEELPF